ncbi:indole-3-glycerol-phosphate synthase [Moraxella caviae]|uniref:Indole-3-glycerol phosphate synthase n=1 Tax=Moraxella caviae TaxID=34060 RepID=A0A1T0A8S7_9GAMM|nr:indole-3-glycerol phosphate synthase TrpC [Moraxella caviae]OOR92080.1 indole-3-glycerol-phosphate synthase [Moraxella caviae]STZ14434.1 Indole-3-glycerol phosphate synthase [Moraxella caviae]VEW10479.1 Indole-3-glycerol phosphate synthase [Moraxella caviae]
MSTPSILQRIVATKHQEIAAAKQSVSLEAIKAQAANRSDKPRGFANALRTKAANNSIGIISEIKKASPSKGVICQNFDPVASAIGYENAGAACLSVLTDREYFQGADDYLQAARNACALPVLRKDFMVDEYHIYESYALGADCILLIMACLDDETVAHLHALAISLGMGVLIEIHTEDELRRALALPRSSHNIYGINNRDLNTFKVDLAHSLRLCQTLFDELGADALVVSESGLNDAHDIRTMQNGGIHHFLIGEQFMKTDNAGAALAQLLDDVTALK